MKALHITGPVRSKGFVPPAYSPFIRKTVTALARSYLFFGEQVSSVTVEDTGDFASLIKRQQEGELRLIITFHHVDKADAPCLMYTLNRKWKGTGPRSHAHFLYGKDVPNWVGAMAGWVFPRLGQIPVQNRGVCRQSMEAIRQALRENRFPLALAPEGQVTYHAHRIYDLQAGTLFMADWAEEEGETLLIPVTFVYDYGRNRKKVLNFTGKKWRERTGYDVRQALESTPAEGLLTMTDQLLDIIEQELGLKPAGSLNERAARVCEACLSEGEKLAELKPSDDIIDRVFHLRYRGMKTLYTENTDPQEWPRARQERGVYDVMRTRLFVRYSQIVDALEYLDTAYITDIPASEGLSNRFCEFALNLLDILNRYRGGDISWRDIPYQRRARLLIGAPLNPSEVRSIQPRRARHQALSNLLKERLTGLARGSEETRP